MIDTFKEACFGKMLLNIDFLDEALAVPGILLRI
jgi:hypothetical protein